VRPWSGNRGSEGMPSAVAYSRYPPMFPVSLRDDGCHPECGGAVGPRENRPRSLTPLVLNQRVSEVPVGGYRWVSIVPTACFINVNSDDLRADQPSAASSPVFRACGLCFTRPPT